MRRLPLVEDAPRWTHACMVSHGHDGTNTVEEVWLRILDTRYEDFQGFHYDRHLAPGHAIIQSKTRYQRRLMLGTLRPLR